MPQTLENLGPAEVILQSLITYADHLYHGRPGMVVADNSAVGAVWTPVTYKEEEGAKVVFHVGKGKKSGSRIGVLLDNNEIQSDTGRKIGEYRPAGIYPEVAVWMYQQVANVYHLDQEFVARWASYAYGQAHRDLKVVLAAFLLVQDRKGDPVKENGQVLFLDSDYRDVGEAMVLLTEKDSYLNPKQLLRIRELLGVPGVAAINRGLGFGRSEKTAFTGRWAKTISKWLAYRENNPSMLQGLVKKGFRRSIIALAAKIGYKPQTPRFFDMLRWKQCQAKDGHRSINIGKVVEAAETWEGLTEEQICERICKDKLDFKIVASNVALTRAIVAATIESGGFSDKDLVIHAPTLEELGLLEVPDIKARWTEALKKAQDLRAMNVARRMKGKEVQEELQAAGEEVLKAVVEEATADIEIYFMVDVSGSMEGAIESAKVFVEKFLYSFPSEKVHVAIFNTVGREVTIKHPSAAGVRVAFTGIRAGGGTDYGVGIKVLSKYRPQEGSDVLFIFVGDEQAPEFSRAVVSSGLEPKAFGLVKVIAPGWDGGNAVTETARNLRIPCFKIDEGVFEDVYALPRVLHNLIVSTPVGTVVSQARARSRVSLVETIIKTDILVKPVWAA